MKKLSLTKHILGSRFMGEGAVSCADGSILKGFEMEPLSAGSFEAGLNGPASEQYHAKLTDLVGKLPNRFEGQVLLSRRKLRGFEVPGFQTKLYVFERVQKVQSYSHLQALLSELGLKPVPITAESWKRLISGMLGDSVEAGKYPDLTWEREFIKCGGGVTRALSLTELPQVTWKGCLQSLFEYPGEFVFSVRIELPDRAKIKRQLETKRRVSHALSITSSLEVRNIESNSVLNSSEETLERILVGKESLFEISAAAILLGDEKDTLGSAREFERVVSGVGNAGLFLEGIGTLPVLKSHLPGNRTLGIRKVPILSENLAHILPLVHDYSRSNDKSELQLRSRSGEVSYLNLFSKENLNYNAFICGASGSGKSFLMNAVLSAVLRDEPGSRLCIFDVGGSYKRIVERCGGKSSVLSISEARALIASYLKLYPVSSEACYRALIQTLCGSGEHITHSHIVAIDDLLREVDGQRLKIKTLITNAQGRTESFYQDVAHWLKPHVELDSVSPRDDLIKLLESPVSAFDFKQLDADPVLQKVTILLLSNLLWRDLLNGKYKRTEIAFDEVWRFFAQSKGYLEEMYRTLRKYRAGIVSITQNLADYGDEAFAKMLFTNSFTKIFLQNGASAEFLKNTFDLPDSDIERALSVVSKKPEYSEFFALTPSMSQVFRLYPTQEFYSLANTENISSK